MARASWKGAISFGLVYIPVELYTAAHSATIDLDYLDITPIGPDLRFTASMRPKPSYPEAERSAV